MSDDFVLQARFELDTADAKKKIEELHQMVASGGSGGSGKSGGSSSSGGGFSSKDAQELTKSLNNLAKVLESATKQIGQATKPGNGGNGRPGGGGGAGNSAFSAARSGQSGLNQLTSSLKSGNIAGVADAASGLKSVGAAGVAAGAALASAELITKTFGAALAEAGQRAQENAKIVSDSGGQYDRLRQSQKMADEQMRRLAGSSPVVAFEEVKNVLTGRFLGGLNQVVDGFGKATGFLSDLFKDDATKKKEAQAKEAAARKPLELVGDARIQRDQIGRQALETERDIANQRKDYEQQIYEKRVQYAQKVQEFELSHQRKLEDLADKKGDEELKYSTNMAKFNENFEGQLAAQKYANARKIADREHEYKLSDMAVEHAQEQRYANEDFKTKQLYARQDKSKNRGDELVDLKNQLTDMGMGGASGLDYLKLARDTRKKFSREDRDFAINQQREGAEYTKGQKRAGEKYDIDVYKENRGFAASKADAAQERQLDILQMENSRKWEGIQLQQEHNIAMRELNKALKRETQDYTIGKNKLGFEAQSMDYADKAARRDMNIRDATSRRSNQEALGGLAQDLRGKLDDEAFVKALAGDKDLQDAYNAQQLRRGEKVGIDFDASSKQLGLTNVKKYQAPQIEGWATGGIIGGNGNDGHPAIVHPGEYIINPNGVDQKRQKELWLDLGQKLGGIPRYDTGGIIGNLLPGVTPVTDRLKAFASRSSASSAGMDQSPVAQNGNAFLDMVNRMAASQAETNARIQQMNETALAGGKAQTGGYLDGGDRAYRMPQNYASLGPDNATSNNTNNITPVPLGPPPSAYNTSPYSNNAPGANSTPQISFNVEGDGGMTPALQKAFNEIRQFAAGKIQNARSQAMVGTLNSEIQTAQFGGQFR